MRGHGVADADRRSPLALSRRGFARAALATCAAAGLGGVATAQRTTFELLGQMEAWVGESPSAVADQENPTLRLEAGQPYAITWTNIDGEPHNVAILDGQDNVLRSTEITDQEGASQTLAFRATPAMAAYRCEVHPTTMRGAIRVAGGSGSANAAGSADASGNRSARSESGANRTDGANEANGTSRTTGTAETAAETAEAESAAPTETEESATVAAEATESNGQPGFGALAAVASAGAALASRLRR